MFAPLPCFLSPPDRSLLRADSGSAKAAKERDAAYIDGAKKELSLLSDAVSASGLSGTLRILLIYVPLAGKAELVRAFDERLKGLQ